ncbi:MAG: histidinol dehydrogenase, partial [Cyanobacteria bacterium WB6_1B_304]|nr:histidinol dehydrogenase [Cyanobacteria bacterium WB6_1B_304]
SSIIQYSPLALQKVAHAIEILAKTEGLPSHGDSVHFRIATITGSSTDE